MKRDIHLDTSKFILIFFVVLGHLLQIDYSKTESVDALYRLIYSFHVPAFAFISGYLTNERSFNIKKFIPLFETIIIGNIIWFCFTDFTFSFTKYLSPQYHLWYLMGLFWWRIYVYISNKYLSKPIVLLIAILSFLVSPLVNFSILSIDLSLTYLPFFVLGNVLQGRIPNLIIKIKVLPCILSFVTIYVLYYVIPELGNIHHVLAGHGPVVYGLDRLLFLLIGSGLTISFLRIIYALPNMNFIAAQGHKNMIYYVYHGFLRFGFIYIIHFILPNGEKLSMFNLNMFILGSVIILLMIYICSKYRFFYWLINPISHLHKR